MNVTTSRFAARAVTALLAVAVMSAAAVIGWTAVHVRNAAGGRHQAVSSPEASAEASQAPSPEASGPEDSFIEFSPDILTGDDGNRVEVRTNLPDGTVYELIDVSYGPKFGSQVGHGFTCCDEIRHGMIVIPVGEGSCNNLVGAVGDSAGFEFTIVVRPVFDNLMMSGPMGASPRPPPAQPDSVLAVLGEHFERLTGDQVVVADDGTRRLEASARFRYPQPECGGDPLPLFGGDPDCPPQREQLQGDHLESVMTDVMGPLSQARMCEFWAINLPPEVEAAHPWPEFAAEWRDWYLHPPKDFSDAESNSGWTLEPFTWHVTDRQGDRYFIDVTHHDVPVISLEIDRLPDYCPDCADNVVPFWGVMAWTLR